MRLNLPTGVAALLRQVSAPPRLAAHLRLVHDVAWQLTAALREYYPALAFDRDAVLFGAATHDIGKVVHPAELSGPGSRHDQAGRELLLAHGVDGRLARLAASHGSSWQEPDAGTEDLLVSLADKVWKAKRVPELEDRVIGRVCAADGGSRWEVFLVLDDLLDGIAARADERLAYQNAYPVHVRPG